jgi:hypothetical protein
VCVCVRMCVCVCVCVCARARANHVFMIGMLSCAHNAMYAYRFSCPAHDIFGTLG